MKNIKDLNTKVHLSKKTVVIVLSAILLLIVALSVVLFTLNKKSGNELVKVDFSKVDPQAVYYYDQQKVDDITKQSFAAKDYPKAAHAIAVAYFAKGEYGKSVEKYQEIVDTTNPSYDIYYDYAVAAYNNKDKTKALELLDKAIATVKLSQMSKDDKSVIIDRINNKKSAMTDVSK
ncbi:tetratricopeptide repeat protein [Candidatus Saccharibacteria bacterium]|jgi:tetratricopeptide (TPR) repeat protein|nr:tetratricopeptide repeat protein [Candidatus Saccharibacteria bacterium]MBP7834886.1 tetratricopeptide repeat protein [Candidatus Saccharibacteria bacterium]MCA9350331.1 tetratricopeptide repeat protein [Candidatus Saccharibacteria bacterium]